MPRKYTIILMTALSISISQPVAYADDGFWGSIKDIFSSDKKKSGDKKTTSSKSLSTNEIGEGLKEALKVGTRTVVNQLGKKDGFYGDKAIFIPLPEKLNGAKQLLQKFGMGDVANNLEKQLNRAAEIATPKAKELFIKSIEDMTLKDVMDIYNGPNDSATRYFKSQMTPELKKEMQPIIDQSLAKVGALQAYDKFIGKYKDLPFVPNVKADLSSYVMERSLDGIFHYVAEEEIAIRKDPLKRTTNILKRVFGS